MVKIAAVLALVIAVWFHGNYYGGVEERARQADARADVKDREAVKVEQIIKWKIKERVVYRDRIKTIHTAADPTGCLDTDLRDVGLAGMLPAADSH